MNALESSEENIKHSKEEMNFPYGKYGRNAREYRRSLVLDLDSQGYTYREIAAKLHISKGTISNDLAFLRKQAQDNLQYHIHELVPEYFQKCLWGIRRDLKQMSEIADSSSDPKMKMEAKKIAIDCKKYIMDLVTNGSVVADAWKRVTEIQNDVNIINRCDQSLKESEGEITTDGVF